MLGAYFNPALGVTGADTLFVDARLAQDLSPRWRVGGAISAGFTMPRADLLAAGSTIRSQAFSFDVTRSDTLLSGDQIGLRISQPLRVSGGALRFALPVAYDYSTESAIYGLQDLSLTPGGRERQVL